MYAFDYSVKYLGVEYGAATPVDALDVGMLVIKEALQKRKKRRK